MGHSEDTVRVQLGYSEGTGRIQWGYSESTEGHSEGSVWVQ